MARDHGLEALVAEQFDGRAGLGGKAMFGGWCWLVRGHLLCGAGHDGLLVRLGKDRDIWALELPGIERMTVGDRAMPGWVRADAEATADDALRLRLIAAALAFVTSLPDKDGIVMPARTRQVGARPAAHGRHQPTSDPKA